MPLNVGLRSCGALCQHPGCWDAVRKKEKGISKSLPPLDLSSSDDSDSELDLPTQSVCNLLADFGESPTDRYPVSTGGRPSHQWDTPLSSASIPKRKETTFSINKLQAPNNTKASLFSKKKSTTVPAPRLPQPCMPMVEVQEVFDCTDLNSQWDETFVTKQYYIWVANPYKRKKRKHGPNMETHRDPNAPLLMKDMTECMVPAEIKQQREDTVLFDEWPVLKKKQPRTASPPAKSLQFKKATMPQPLALPAPPPVDVDMEGINELLALPKDVLLKVLEHTKKSDFTSKGKLHEVVQECIQGNESARMMLSTRELLRQKKMKILNIPKGAVHKSHPTPSKPVFQIDDEQVIERMSSANTPVKDKACSDDSSVESFPRYTKPLPKIQGYPYSLSYQLVGPGELMQAPDSVRLPIKAKLPSISLGLPELPSGVKTTKAFAYNNKNSMDFSLGPVISPPTTHRSSESGDYSEHGTTVKVNAPMSGLGYTEILRDNDVAIHCVSPALSTNVPVAPAGTPATFMSPTKSAPNLREITRDPTQLTVNLSIKAQPSSKDLRETTFLSSPMSNSAHPLPIPTSPAADSKFPMTPDEKGLDTIRETAREAGIDGSVVSSSHGTLGDRLDEPPKLVLQTSTMTNINTAVSPLPKSARSVESCPSPEQWPLISESSFEKMIPRSSVSEPALSGRSGRRSLSRSLDDNGKDYARKVMDEKKTAESPAPPPPSPEPKDSNEYRARKDLKSRESLSMAPLFEVNELEEDVYDENRHENDGRRKQVRKIHAVIPQANTDDDRKIEPEESEEVMVSQITVMHVAPKGTRDQQDDNMKQEKEKVQETFLNVDIPAEEISSCKAEHGSSRQEDIPSTNESATKSEVTTTNSQASVSTVVGKGDGKEYEEEEKEDNKNLGEETGEEFKDEVNEVGEKDALDERHYLEMQSDYIHRDRNDSAKLNSEDSGLSPELVCDSARFLSHDLVSPMEGEMDEGEMQMAALLQQVEGTEDAETMGEIQIKIGEDANNLGENNPGIENEGRNNGDGLDVGSREIIGEESKREEYIDDSGKNRETSAVSNETTVSDIIEPPGSFFFQQDAENQDKGEESTSLNLKDDIEKAENEEVGNNISGQDIAEKREDTIKEAMKEIDVKDASNDDREEEIISNKDDNGEDQDGELELDDDKADGDLKSHKENFELASENIEGDQKTEDEKNVVKSDNNNDMVNKSSCDENDNDKKSISPDQNNSSGNTGLFSQCTMNKDDDECVTSKTENKIVDEQTSKDMSNIDTEDINRIDVTGE